MSPEALRAGRGRQSHRSARTLVRLAQLGLVAAIGVFSPAYAQSSKVRISGLADVSYGTILNLQADSRRTQSICVSANTANDLYSVTASGNGPGGALELSNGSSALPYSVEWSASPGQTAGANLSANSALVSQNSPEKQQDCKSRGLDTASLIVVMRGTELSKAIQGAYSGTLTLLIAAQ